MKVGLFINLCFQSSLQSATDCYRTGKQIQQDAWGSALELHAITFLVHRNILCVRALAYVQKHAVSFKHNIIHDYRCLLATI